MMLAFPPASPSTHKVHQAHVHASLFGSSQNITTMSLHKPWSAASAVMQRKLTLASMQELAQQGKTILAAILRPDNSLRFLKPGRLVTVRSLPGQAPWGIGVVVNVSRQAGTRSATPVRFCLLHVSHAGASAWWSTSAGRQVPDLPHLLCLSAMCEWFCQCL